MSFYRAEGGASSLGLGPVNGPIIAGHEPCDAVGQGDGGAHKSMDCSSSPEARVAAIRCVRTWGAACFVGEAVSMGHY